MLLLLRKTRNGLIRLWQRVYPTSLVGWFYLVGSRIAGSRGYKGAKRPLRTISNVWLCKGLTLELLVLSFVLSLSAGEESKRIWERTSKKGFWKVAAGGEMSQPRPPAAWPFSGADPCSFGSFFNQCGGIGFSRCQILLLALLHFIYWWRMQSALWNRWLQPQRAQQSNVRDDMVTEVIPQSERHQSTRYPREGNELFSDRLISLSSILRFESMSMVVCLLCLPYN